MNKKTIINKDGSITIIENFKTDVTIEKVGTKGDIGQKGDDGLNGEDGLNGQGVATGGTTGQVLVKKSNTDFDTEWQDVASGEDFNYLVGSAVAFNQGTAGTNNWITKNTVGTSTSGQISVNTPNGTTLYDLRPKNSYRTGDSPSTITSATYYVPTFPKQFGNANFSGFKTEIDFVIETNLDNKHKFYVGELSSFVNIPNMQNGPSSFFNNVGFGYDELDTIFYAYINNNTANPIKIPLSDFSGNLQASDYAARLILQPILISIELLPGANTIIFKYKHLLSGRSGTYTLNNPAKKPISTTVLKSAVAMQGGQSVPVGDTFSIYSFFMSKRIR